MAAAVDADQSPGVTRTVGSEWPDPEERWLNDAR